MRMRLLWSARAACALGITLLALTATCRTTLLRPHFASQSVARVDGFERLYSEVLPSATVQSSLRQSLAPLPLDATYVTANLRLLLPPEVLDAVLTRLQTQYVAVLTGQRHAVSGPTALQPVVDHAVSVVRELLPGLTAAAPRLSARSVADFSVAFQAWLSDVHAGRPPVALPTVPLDAANAERLSQVLTSRASPVDRERVTPELVSLLRGGDLMGALATVLPLYLDDQVSAALLATMVQATRSVSALSPVEAGLPGGLHLPISVTWLAVLGAVMTAGGALVGARRANLVRELAITVPLALSVALLTGMVASKVVPDPLRDAAASPALPGEQRRLLSDIDRQVRTDLGHAFLSVLAAMALATAVVTLLARSLRSPEGSRARQLTIGAWTAALGTTAAAVLLHTSPVPRTCNGTEVLCARTYDAATYLTSHNAMASSARGFINADQDPDLEGQLDNGVRGLMLDLHPWTTPQELSAFAASLDAPTRAAWSPLLRPLTPRPGVWLCHVACQAGSDRALDQFRRLGSWMRAHPDAVVTLILEDHVSEQDVRDTVLDAGLRSLLATPPTNGAPWPTLGRMVRTGHRLVVLTERARPATGWLRNFYDYAAETPYDAKSAADLSCKQGRGPASASLFLINNWVSTPAPSRAAARQVNDAAALRRRAAACQVARGMRPTFIAVDFAQTGDPLSLVNDLNRPAGIRLVTP
jgi:hypothetical protein